MSVFVIIGRLQKNLAKVLFKININYVDIDNNNKISYMNKLIFEKLIIN